MRRWRTHFPTNLKMDRFSESIPASAGTSERLKCCPEAQKHAVVRVRGFGQCLVTGRLVVRRASRLKPERTR
jgi:hypothetical protein